MSKYVVKILRKKTDLVLLKKQKYSIIYYIKYEKGDMENMDNKEFVEYIKKYGDIRPVQEAFEKYPVEEEEHKGKLESYSKVAEEAAIYNNP